MAANKNSTDSFWFRYTLSCCAATVAESATYPLDIAKTRLQIQGEQIQRRQKTVSNHLIAKRGFVSTISGIVKEEGLIKLWQGVTPAVVRHFVYTGVRVITYETLRDKLFEHKSDGAFPLWEAMCSGMTSGAFAQFLASPTDLIKVQMQMEGRRRLEGLPPSACSGLTAAIVSTPADVIKTRIMNQPTDVNGKGILYNSSFDCLKKTVKNEGFFALYKGFVPIWARMAPWSLTFWISYEKIRGLSGVESF